MKLLIILKDVFPVHLNTGGKQAIFHIVDYLRNKMDISILFDVQSNVSDVDIRNLERKWDNVKFFRYTANKKMNFFFFQKQLMRFLYKLFSSNNDIVKTRRLNKGIEIPDMEFLCYINQIIEQEQFDIVQTEFYQALDLVFALPKNIKRVFVQHEIRYVREELFLNNQQKKVNVRDTYLLKKLKCNEIAAMNQYDLVITLTEVDKNKLKEAGVSCKVEDSPPCIPCYKSPKNIKITTNQLVFLGGSVHPPNVEGLKWFLKEVWGFILQQNRKMELNIIGSWSKNYIEQFTSKYVNVKFLGVVEDLEPVMSGRIMIIPILSGSGIRMKALEAINYGCPIVTTPVGIEGLNFTNKTDCFIADTAINFADRIITLTNSHLLQEKFIQNAKHWYMDEYSIEKLGNRRLSIYEDLAGDGSFK